MFINSRIVWCTLQDKKRKPIKTRKIQFELEGGKSVRDSILFLNLLLVPGFQRILNNHKSVRKMAELTIKQPCTLLGPV